MGLRYCAYDMLRAGPYKLLSRVRTLFRTTLCSVASNFSLILLYLCSTVYEYASLFYFLLCRKMLFVKESNRRIRLVR